MADTALRFDRPEVNVDLAKQYLKENKCDIKNINLKEKDENEWDSDKKKREMLAKKIKENSKLICQLEYMTNNTPIEESEKNIQLMLQYLSLSKKYRLTALFHALWIFKNTPLALLIFAIETSILKVCEERSAVCHLILKLCEDTGLLCSTNFQVNIMERSSTGLYNNLGCTGIVSERSDLDSAVDAFLSSSYSSNCFWRLGRIFVQESIVQSFKELIEFKAKLKETRTKEYEELKKLCSELFVYENKVLLFDYAGNADALRLDSAHVIFIEAYRTNKEVLSLVGEKARNGCVSLWCADVAEANELAYSVPASLVWINDYGNFDGPAEMGTFLFNLFRTNELEGVRYLSQSIIDSYEIWKTYDNKKRANIISNVLEQVKENSSLSDEGKNTKYHMLKLLEQISNIKFSAVDVAEGKICVTLDSSVGFCYVDSIEFDAEVLGSLVIGNGTLCNYFVPTNELSQLIPSLQHAGVPIWTNIHTLRHKTDEINEIRLKNFSYLTKVVMTNFGTIFAN